MPCDATDIELDVALLLALTASPILSSTLKFHCKSCSCTSAFAIIYPRVWHHTDVHGFCRERRLVAVQTTYGALLPPDMTHSCSDMSTTLMLSDARISSSLGSGSLGFACEDCPPMDCADSDAQTLLFGSFDEEQEQARRHTLPSACLSELFHVLRYERMVFISLGVLFAMLQKALCLCNAA